MLNDRASLAVAAAILLLGGAPIPADDEVDQAKKAARPATPPAPPMAKTKEAPSPEQAGGLLREALKLVQTLAGDAARREFQMGLRSPDDFAMRFKKDQHADFLRAIGRAQARLGDLPAARATWQSALEVAAAVTFVNSSLAPTSDRATLILSIAGAQFEAGERDEVRFAIRQALQAARSVEPEMPFRLPRPPGMEFGEDRGAQKASALHRIAQLQSRLGEAASAQETDRLAIQAAESIEVPLNRVQALVKVADGAPPEVAEGLWTKALDFAMAQEEYIRAQGVEAVLRGRMLAGQVDAALAMVDAQLKGDLRTYGLWVLADAIAAGDMAIRPEAIERLYQLVLKAEFDRPSKRFKTFRRLAEAQARLGAYEEAYRTVGQPRPAHGGQNFLAKQARAYVMTAVARSQLKAGQAAAARDTALAALELIALQPDDEGVQIVLPLVALGDLLARAGDLNAAMGLADAIASSSARVRIFAKTAVAQARAGKLDDARRTLRRAIAAAEGTPNEAIWSRATYTGGAASVAPDPRPAVRQTIAQAQAAMGDLDAAIQTISEMGHSTFAPFARKEAVEQIVGLRLEDGDIAGARRAADLITSADPMSQGDKVDLLERIARSQAHQFDPAMVLDWARKESAPRVKLQLLRGLADGLAERFDPKAKPSSPDDAAGRPQPRRPGP